MDIRVVPAEGRLPAARGGGRSRSRTQTEADAEAEAGPRRRTTRDPRRRRGSRVVPVGGDAPRLSGGRGCPATPANPGPGGVSPPEPDASGTPSRTRTRRRHARPRRARDPRGEITIIPGVGDSARPSSARGARDRRFDSEGRRSGDDSRGAGGGGFLAVDGDPPTSPDPTRVFRGVRRVGYPACPSAAADPLASANVRGSFQLLRAREAETGGEDRASLTLLRPGDEAREIFVTGTLINAGDAAACLRDVEIPFEFPYAVALAPGAPRRVPPSDFVASCYYVGVRSREASAAPGTRAANENAFEDAVAGAERPRACEDVVDLRVEDAGPVMAFGDDIALCPGCWLVGGRDGVLFSWKHKDGLAMTVRAGDDVGAAAPRCAAAEDAGAAGP